MRHLPIWISSLLLILSLTGKSRAQVDEASGDDLIVAFEPFLERILQKGDTIHVIYVYNSFCQGCIASFPKLALLAMAKYQCPVQLWMTSLDKQEETWMRLLSRTTTGWAHVWIAPEYREIFEKEVYKETVIPTIYVWQDGKKSKQPSSLNKLESLLLNSCSK